MVTEPYISSVRGFSSSTVWNTENVFNTAKRIQAAIEQVRIGHWIYVNLAISWGWVYLGTARHLELVDMKHDPSRQPIFSDPLALSFFLQFAFSLPVPAFLCGPNDLRCLGSLSLAASLAMLNLFVAMSEIAG